MPMTKHGQRPDSTIKGMELVGCGARAYTLGELQRTHINAMPTTDLLHYVNFTLPTDAWKEYFTLHSPTSFYHCISKWVTLNPLFTPWSTFEYNIQVILLSKKIHFFLAQWWHIFEWGKWLTEPIYNSHVQKMGMWADGPSAGEPVAWQSQKTCERGRGCNGWGKEY